MHNFIYGVFEDWCIDYEDGSTKQLFKNYEDAKKTFNECVQGVQELKDTLNIEDVSEEDTYCIYEDGYYSNNHYNVEIKKLEVK